MNFRDFLDFFLFFLIFNQLKFELKFIKIILILCADMAADMARAEKKKKHATWRYMRLPRVTHILVCARV